MSLNWYPGQRVVCVVVPKQTFYCEKVPFKGQILTIRAVQEIKGLVALRFCEILNCEHPYQEGFMEVWFHKSGFKLLNESRLDQLRKHLVKKPERQDA